jgi:hypothetical protein
MLVHPAAHSTDVDNKAQEITLDGSCLVYLSLLFPLSLSLSLNVCCAPGLELEGVRGDDDYELPSRRQRQPRLQGMQAGVRYLFVAV